jgi:Na+-translocating ferredoxin:NAD+ oxidoreductase RnfG subunit
MRETPGIGDKIITDEAFLKNFEALDVKLAADMKALANAVKVVKHGTKQNAWEIDAISGATVTSKAVGTRHQRERQEAAALAGAEPGEIEDGAFRDTPCGCVPPFHKGGTGGI